MTTYPVRAEKEFVVYRAEWGALPSTKFVKPQKYPMDILLIYYSTDTPRCETREECVLACQQIQRRHMDQGLPDIAYSFLIGGDGFVYEGRGWRHKPSKLIQEHVDQLGSKTLDIAYIGKYTSVIDVTDEMALVGCELLTVGINNKRLSFPPTIIEVKDDTSFLQ